MSLATIITSILAAGSNSHPTTNYEANAFATDFVGQGIVGSISNTLGVAPATGGFGVNAQASPAMFVDVLAGVAWITATPTGQLSQSVRALMSSNTTSYTISANASGSTKYDWIYLKVDPTAAANPDVAGDNVVALYTSRSSSNTVDNNLPPTYGLLLAVVTVANGASSITNANVTDSRVQATPSAQISAAGTGWTATTAPTSVTYNGNRSYSVVFNSTDLTGSVSKGMRAKATRTVVAPTLCTTLNGSTQYYNKTSPAAMTFTDDFTVSAWIKVTTNASQRIVSRYNGTSGWELALTATGSVVLAGYNASASNFSIVTSFQSVPLNKWVHVTAQLDMSSFTATPTTSYVMIDGIDVPVSVTRGGTNPTALVQAGNLEVGSGNGGTNLFTGELAQVAVFNAKVTQATIRGYISQTLSGSETSLISAYSFSNTINDLSANANNLTAQGSAVATTADNPFANSTGSVSYAIITGATFSTNTTLTVQVPEGMNIPTTGGVSALAYSTHKTPYGFPTQDGRWVVQTLMRQSLTTASPTNGTWVNALGAGLVAMNIPIGEWNLSHSPILLAQTSGNTEVDTNATLATTTAAETDDEFTIILDANVASSSAATTVIASTHRKKSISLAAATPYYWNYRANRASMTSAGIYYGNGGMSKIEAELAYL